MENNNLSHHQLSFLPHKFCFVLIVQDACNVWFVFFSNVWLNITSQSQDVLSRVTPFLKMEVHRLLKQREDELKSVVSQIQAQRIRAI